MFDFMSTRSKILAGVAATANVAIIASAIADLRSDKELGEEIDEKIADEVVDPTVGI